MRVLIDTNVALAYVSGREDPFSNEVDAIMQKCAKEEIEGALAFGSISQQPIRLFPKTRSLILFLGNYE